jgi:glutathione S-transferase
MTTTPQFELVSFDLCPYVQRSVITLKQKKIDFKITYIDLEKPPEWFSKASPLGKVPLLLVRRNSPNEPVDEPVVLFESAVINEYIDEVTPSSLLPKDPLEKARMRAWIQVSGELLMAMYPIMSSRDQGEILEARKDVWDILEKVEEAVAGGSFFSLTGFTLVDSAFAPVFMRLLMMKSFREDPQWKQLPKTRRWADCLLALPEVRESVIPEFKQKFISYLQRKDSLAVRDIS